MSYFSKVFTLYNKPLRGLVYTPLRWSIVPFELIESYLPKNGKIIDIGCGEGIMSTLLAVSSKRRTVLGLDVNADKIKFAKSVSKNIPNLEFIIENVLKKNNLKADGFILSDFLHHIPKNHQKPLLKKIASMLNEKGTIIIKEIDSGEKLRSMISRFFDFIFYPGDDINFINSQNLKEFLINLGFKVSIIKTKKWFPGSTTLIICQK